MKWAHANTLWLSRPTFHLHNGYFEPTYAAFDPNFKDGDIFSLFMLFEPTGHSGIIYLKKKNQC